MSVLSAEERRTKMDQNNKWKVFMEATAFFQKSLVPTWQQDEDALRVL